MEDRKKYLKNIKRVVIKIGSSSLTSKAGGLDRTSMKKFVDEASSLVRREIEVIIVTSGAIAAGLESLKIKNLIGLNIIPVINENDSVAVDEIKFGDNYQLAALVAILAEADTLIILH